MLTLTNKHTSRCCVLLSVTAENQTIYPSACVIPSNQSQSYVATAEKNPHMNLSIMQPRLCVFIVLFFSSAHPSNLT